MEKTIKINSVDTKNIGINDLKEIAYVQKDMWAFGLGEYVKCNNCNTIMSKNDIFGHLSLDIRKESVSKLEEIFLGDTIDCNNCNSGNTDFIHDVDKSIKIFMDRYKKESFLVLANTNSGDIVGFCDGYVGTFDEIYENDLSQHYGEVENKFIKKTIKDKLNVKYLEKMLYFSSMGTYENYTNYILIYELLRGFFKSININEKLHGITELDKNNSLYKIYKLMGSISIGLDTNSVNNTYKNYNSDICIFPNPIEDFKSKYDLPFKQLVKNHNIK